MANQEKYVVDQKILDELAISEAEYDLILEKLILRAFGPLGVLLDLLGLAPMSWQFQVHVLRILHFFLLILKFPFVFQISFRFFCHFFE